MRWDFSYYLIVYFIIFMLWKSEDIIPCFIWCVLFCSHSLYVCVALCRMKYFPLCTIVSTQHISSVHLFFFLVLVVGCRLLLLPLLLFQFEYNWYFMLFVILFASHTYCLGWFVVRLWARVFHLYISIYIFILLFFVVVVVVVTVGFVILLYT